MSYLEEFDGWFDKLWTNTICGEYRNRIVEREADVVASLYHHARSHNKRWGLRCQVKGVDPKREIPEDTVPAARTVCSMDHDTWLDKASRRRIDLEVRLPNGTVIPIEVKTFWQMGTKGLTKDLENLWFRVGNPYIKVAACYYCMVGYYGPFRLERDPKGEFFSSKIREVVSQREYAWTQGMLRVAFGSKQKEHQWRIVRL